MTSIERYSVDVRAPLDAQGNVDYGLNPITVEFQPLSSGADTDPGRTLALLERFWRVMYTIVLAPIRDTSASGKPSPEHKYIVDIKNEGRVDDLASVLLRWGYLLKDNDQLYFTKSLFWQLDPLQSSSGDVPSPLSFLRYSNATIPPVYSMTNGIVHPIRLPAPPQGQEVYRRYIPSLKATFSLRMASMDIDSERFSLWMNDDRVAKFWNMKTDRSRQDAYLQSQIDSKHSLPLIGCFDDTPFMYTEVYWVKEDSLSPYAQPDDYDRGFHVLVGEQLFRGPHRVPVWITSIVHFILLSDQRTQNVYLEPRADNTKLIKYLQDVGFYKKKEFDFPHKRAALMILPRETFSRAGPTI